jgi:hypothetical protein
MGKVCSNSMPVLLNSRVVIVGGRDKNDTADECYEMETNTRSMDNEVLQRRRGQSKESGKVRTQQLLA